jgi:signal transduction histidine kinase
VQADGRPITATRFTAPEHLRRVTSEGFRRASEGQTGVAEYEDYRGVRVLGSYAPFSPAQVPGAPRWVILSEIDLEEALEPMHELERELAYLSLLIIALALAVVAFASRMVTRPLRELEAAAVGISQGDWSRRVAVGTHDEFGRLGLSFNSMARKTEETLGALTRTNRSLNESEALLADAQRAGQLGSWSLDLVSDQLTWSKEHYRLFGVQPGSFVPTLDAMHARVHPDDLAALKLAEKAALEDRTAFDVDYRILRGPEEVRYIHSTGTVTLGADGRPASFHGSSQDVTDRKRLELALREQFAALQKLDELKTTFVGAITHDLRTPITVILGYAELLEDGSEGELTAAQRNDVQLIRRSGLQLARMIADLLDSARLEAGTLELAEAPTDMTALMCAEVEAFRPKALGAGLKLEVDVPEDAPLVCADADRMERVVANFLGNAIKFTPPGGTVRVTARVEDNAFVGSVSDTGPGIDPADVPKLFQRFSQLEEGRRHRGGTGLGLSIAKAIVEAHEGSVGVTSTPGRGSTFWFRLPLSMGNSSAA